MASSADGTRFRSRPVTTPLASLLLGVIALLSWRCGSCGPEGSIDLVRSKLTLDRSTGVIANGTAQVTVTVTVVDPDGRPVPGVTVLLEASGEDNVLAGPQATTDAQGQATGTLASTRAETKIVRARVRTSGPDSELLDLAQRVSVQFLPGPAARLAFVAQPSTAQAGVPISPAVQVSVLDAHGNAASGHAIHVDMVLGNNPSVATLSGTISRSAIGGVATFSDLTLDRIGASYTLIASSTAVASVTSVPFNITAGPPSRLVFLTQPERTDAGRSFTLPVRVGLADPFGNIAPDAVDPITLALTGGTVGATLAGTTTVNATAGVATFHDVSIGRIGAGYSLIATASGYAGALSIPFDVSAGAPSTSTSTLEANPSSPTADGASSAALKLTARDIHGNPVPNQTISFFSTGSNNTFLPDPPSGSTDGTGVFSVRLTSTTAEAKAVTAVTGGLDLATTVVDFGSGAPSAVTSSITASSASVIANGTDTVTLTVTVKDARGNPVPNQAVSLSASGTGNTFSPDPPQGTTDAGGTFTATLASTRVEPKTVTATVSGFTLTTPVAFTPGPPSAATSTLVANPTTVVANGASTTTLTVTVKDAYGNVVPEQPVSLSASGDGNAFSPASGTTDASGIFTAKLASTRAEAKTVTATMGDATSSASVTFTPGPPSAATSTLVANPTAVTANGTSVTTLTLTLRDASGNLIPGQAVILSASGSGNTFSPASGSTSASGVFTATLRSTRAELKTVRATAGNLALSTSINFVAGTPSATLSTITANPTSVVANGTSTTTLTVTVKDANGNLVPSQAVTLSSSGTGNSFSPISGTTNGAGTFTATFRSIVAETKSVRATVGGFTVTTSVTFLPGGPSAATSTLTANPTSVVANGTSTTTLTVTVRDVSGAPISGQTVNLSSTGSGNVLVPASGSTNASGVFTATLASTTVETKTVTATAGSMSLTAAVVFNNPPSPTQSTLTASPTSVVANGTSTTTLTVTVRDASGAPISGQAVSLSSTGTSNTFTPNPPSGVTDASGVFTATLASTTSETKTVTATVGSFNLTTSVTFTPLAATYSQSFTSGVAPSTQCTSWATFRGSLTGVYSSITIRGTYDSVGVTCTGASANTLCSALRTATRTTVSCGGRTWSVSAAGDCGPDVELSASGACVCSARYVLRPCIGTADWGGVNTTSCTPPSQTMTVVCQ